MIPVVSKKKARSPSKKIGRPRFDFSEKLPIIRQLASIQCTDEEIAASIGCSQDTLARGRKRDPEVEAAMTEGRAQGRMSLRRAQYKQALSGNSTMLIWLGKQVLGQRDQAAEDSKSEDVDWKSVGRQFAEAVAGIKSFTREEVLGE